jgi:hypothetical protein
MWVTRGPFRRLPKGLCDFVDTTTHTLVGGAQTTLSRQRPARARIVETADWPLANAKRDVDLEINKTHTPPLGALDHRGGAGATGAVGTAPKWLVYVRIPVWERGLF